MRSMQHAVLSGVWCTDQFLGDIALTAEDLQIARQRQLRRQPTHGETTTVTPTLVDAQYKPTRRRHTSRC